jgi:RHS repeat-associated protein
MQGAGGVGGLLSVTDSTGTCYPTFDGNGNVSEYLDSTGSIVAHYEFDPFGKTTVATGSKANDFAHRFSTKTLDLTTGLYYYGYRWYDPETGRWPSRDPIEEMGGVNLYGFVGNDGVGWIDLLGLEFKWHHELPEQFKEIFKELGIDNGSEEFGRLFNTDGPHGWNRVHVEWNNKWYDYFYDENGNRIKRTKQSVLRYLEELRSDEFFSEYYDHSSSCRGYGSYSYHVKSQKRLNYYKKIFAAKKSATGLYPKLRKNRKSIFIFFIAAAGAASAKDKADEVDILMIQALDDLQTALDNPEDVNYQDTASISIALLAKHFGGDLAFGYNEQMIRAELTKITTSSCPCE